MILYKYYPVNENSFKSLAVGAFWCHTYDKMNDPFECLLNAKRELTSNEVEEFLQVCANSSNPIFKKFLNSDKKDISNKLNKIRTTIFPPYAFCSFSASMENILMWSHYASSHAGFVIGIDFPVEDSCLFQKVEYLDTLPKFDAISYIKALESRSIPKEKRVTDFNFYFKEYSLKAKCWEYEKEWRFWSSKIGYRPYLPEQVKELYFGIRCEDSTKYTVLKLLNFIEGDLIVRQMIFQDNPVGLGVGKA